jgi:hypothetical protein
MLKIGLCSSNIFSLSTVPISLGFGKDHLKQGANPTKKKYFASSDPHHDISKQLVDTTFV